MGGVTLPLLFSQENKIQATVDLTFLAMEKWMSVREAGCDRLVVDSVPAWGVLNRKPSGAEGSGTG